jgi:MFS transporter, Spinster family, sphingosine-1-phosphate transporter
VSEAFYMPAALALIADYHPGPTRARAIGIHQSGIYAGLILGGLGGYIAQTRSWRNCFIWFGLAGIIYSFTLVLILRRGPMVQPEREEENARATALQTLRALFSKRGYWIMVAYFTLPATAGWAMKNWLPTFLSDRFHLKEGPAGLSATSYINIASFAGVLFGGILADRWMRRTHRGRLYTSALGCLMIVPALIGLGAGGTVPAAVLFMIIFGLGWGLFDCNNMPILCQIAQPRHRATGYGLMNCVSIAVGAAVTVLLGWMRDQGISFAIAFTVCAAMALLGAVLILLGRRQLDGNTRDLPPIADGVTNIR